MKTVVATLKMPWIVAVPVSVPDWWDESTAKARLSSPSWIADLGDLADPDGWEPTFVDAEVAFVAAPAVAVEPVASFGADDDPMPAHPDQEEMAL